MNNQWFVNGLVVLTAGLPASSVSSFLADVALLATATEFMRGFFDGLSVAGFAAATWLPVRSGRSPRV